MESDRLSRLWPYNPAMAHTHETPPLPDASGDQNRTTLTSSNRAGCRDEAMLCERCGNGDMYRMHAVWRCPECGFKTDCCGW